MGSSIIARCPCGFTSHQMLLGGGMLNFKTTHLSPCLCRRCHEVFSGNIKQPPVLCPKCGQEGEIYGKEVPDPPIWRDMKLAEAKFECPKCGQRSLEFGMGSLLWD